MRKNVKEYTYVELSKLTLLQLNRIKKRKYDDFYELRKEKEVIIGAILSTQSLIKSERKSLKT